MRLLLTLPDPVHLLQSNRAQVYFAEAIQGALEGSVRTNEVILRNNPQLPWLKNSGIEFRQEPADYGPMGELEVVPDYLTMIGWGWGDCAPLSTARVAELRVRKREPATIRIYWRPERRPMPIHVQVRRANGDIEDPARFMGMVGSASH